MALKKNNSNKQTSAKTKYRKKTRKNKRQTKWDMSIVTEFLFESVFQTVTLIFIALTIGAIWYFIAVNSWRGTMWAVATLLCLAVIMISIIADRLFFRAIIPAIIPAAQTTETVSSPPFSVALKNLLISGREFQTVWWFVYSSRHGETISPIHLIANVQLVNNQAVPSMVDVLRFETRSNEGVWVELTKSDARTCTLIFASKELSQADVFDVQESGLDFALDQKSVPPHETVNGWVFFEIPRGYDEHNPMRVYVRDTAGKETTQTLKLEKPGSMQNMGLTLTGERIDASSYYKKYRNNPD